MTLLYCTLTFQIITYWNYKPIHLTMKDNLKHSLSMTKNLNYTSVEYGHEVVTWGASLKKCQPISAYDQLEFIGYFIEFDGDGKGCR